MQRKDNPEILSYQVCLWKHRKGRTFGKHEYYSIRVIPLRHLQAAIFSMAETYDSNGLYDPYGLALDLLYKELARRVK